jgi:4a-hydroxytetrahydrobiopterin dehydratase
MALREETCIPCRDGGPTLSEAEIASVMEELPGWSVIDHHHLHKEWCFPDFRSALLWLNQAAEICEAQGHHADFRIGWGLVTVDLHTHKAGGLTRSDGVLAAKFDTIPYGS